MRTEIATLGEFGLIRHLTEGIELKNESSRYGVGDDAAVLSYPAEKEVLVTTDLLMEGVHFDLVYVPLKHLGYKSAVVNFSDIYAMNGTQVAADANQVGFAGTIAVDHFSFLTLAYAGDADGKPSIGSGGVSSHDVNIIFLSTIRRL